MSAEEEGKIKSAQDTAAEWLKLIDDEKYEESWENAAALFKKAVSVEIWRQKMEASIQPLGKVLSRNIKSSKYATELPGAPDGEYVVIQFSSSFENKKTAVETVTPMLDADGIWRVSGYYIR